MFNFRQPLPVELKLRVGGGHHITSQSCRAYRVSIVSDRHHLSAQALAHAITLQIRIRDEKEGYDNTQGTCCCTVESPSTVLLYLFGSSHLTSRLKVRLD